MTTLIITFKCPNDDAEIESDCRLSATDAVGTLDALRFSVIARNVSGRGRYKESSIWSSTG